MTVIGRPPPAPPLFSPSGKGDGPQKTFVLNKGVIAALGLSQDDLAVLKLHGIDDSTTIEDLVEAASSDSKSLLIQDAEGLGKLPMPSRLTESIKLFLSAQKINSADEFAGLGKLINSLFVTNFRDQGSQVKERAYKLFRRETGPDSVSWPLEFFRIYFLSLLKSRAEFNDARSTYLLNMALNISYNLLTCEFGHGRVVRNLADALESSASKQPQVFGVIHSLLKGELNYPDLPFAGAEPQSLGSDIELPFWIKGVHHSEVIEPDYQSSLATASKVLAQIHPGQKEQSSKYKAWHSPLEVITELAKNKEQLVINLKDVDLLVSPRIVSRFLDRLLTDLASQRKAFDKLLVLEELLISPLRRLYLHLQKDDTAIKDVDDFFNSQYQTSSLEEFLSIDLNRFKDNEGIAYLQAAFAFANSIKRYLNMHQQTKVSVIDDEYELRDKNTLVFGQIPWERVPDSLTVSLEDLKDKDYVLDELASWEGKWDLDFSLIPYLQGQTYHHFKQHDNDGLGCVGTLINGNERLKSSIAQAGLRTMINNELEHHFDTVDLQIGYVTDDEDDDDDDDEIFEPDVPTGGLHVDELVGAYS